MSAIFLTTAELAELTGRHTRPAQVRVLERMRMPHVIDGAGRVKVLRAAVEARLGLAVPPGIGSLAGAEPDFSIFDRAA